MIVDTQVATDLSLSLINGAVCYEILFDDKKKIMDVVNETYRQHGKKQTINPDSYFLRFPEQPRNRIIALPAAITGGHSGRNICGIKWISSFPDNKERGLPRASALLILNDFETGIPIACLESTWISAVRTAASAASFAREIALNSDYQRIGIIGTGVIAQTVLSFLLDHRVPVHEIHVYDLDVRVSEQFVQKIKQDPNYTSTTKMVIQPSVSAVIRASSLSVFATTASEPHFDDVESLAANPIVLHLSLRDLTPNVILKCCNYVDDIDHALKAQTSLYLTEQKTHNREFITGTMPQLLLSNERPDRMKPTVFSPFGMGILDIAVGRYVLEVARKNGKAQVMADFYQF